MMCEKASSFSEGAAEGTLVDLLRHRAATAADREAFAFISDHDLEIVMTYRDLDRRARAIGAELQRLAPPGSRAMLLFPPGLEFISAFFGCLYAGIAAVPVAPPGRNRFAWSAEPIFEAAKPALVLSTQRHCEEAARSYAPGPLLDHSWIAVDTIDDARANDWRDLQVDRGQTAFLQYTSGSTSAPKGVMLSHANLLHNASLIRPAFGITAESSAVFWLPLYHDMGLIGGVIQPIYCGGLCTLMAPAAFLQRPLLWLDTISRKRATVSGGPDFAFDLCARKIRPEDRAKLDLSCWKTAFVGAERVRAQTLERFVESFAPCGFRKQSLFPCYGLAEATLFVSGGPCQTEPTVVHVDSAALGRHEIREVAADAASSRSLVACGENLPGQRLAIVDPKSRHLCANGQVGEIWVQGRSVAQGYYDQPEATEKAFHGLIAETGEGPFLRTGDLGFLRKGQLFVTGRLKDVIIIRGRNYYPEDIEQSAEKAYEGLRPGHCAAFSVDSGDRERLAIVQEVEPRHRNLDAQRALHAIRLAVAVKHEVEVDAIALVKAGTIPKTSSGKTRRSESRQRYLSGEMEILSQWNAKLGDSEDEADRGLSAPCPRSVRASEVENWLIERIAARMRLSRAHVRVDAPFLEFGMSSLDAMEIAADLECWLRRPLSPTAIYNHPTIAALAAWAANSSAGSPAKGQRPVEEPESDPFQEEVLQMTQEEMEAFIMREAESLQDNEMVKQEGQ